MAVGFEYGLLPDDNITATSSLHDKVPWKARLAGEEAWCPHTNSSVEYLEVALDSLHRICALATQGLHAIEAYTTTYRLQLSIDGSKWEWYNNGSSEVDNLLIGGAGILYEPKQVGQVAVLVRPHMNGLIPTTNYRINYRTNAPSSKQ